MLGAYEDAAKVVAYVFIRAKKINDMKSVIAFFSLKSYVSFYSEEVRE